MKKPICAATCLILASFLAQAAEQPGADPHTSMERSNSSTSTSDSGTHNSDNTNSEHTKADNTNINERDRNAQTLTPMDQSNTKADIKETQAIRKSLMDNELSTTAKNIKIITRNGNVTLRGPVASAEEKKQIVKLAKAVPGIKKIRNQLEVK